MIRIKLFNKKITYINCNLHSFIKILGKDITIFYKRDKLLIKLSKLSDVMQNSVPISPSARLHVFLETYDISALRLYGVFLSEPKNRFCVAKGYIQKSIINFLFFLGVLNFIILNLFHFK